MREYGVCQTVLITLALAFAGYAVQGCPEAQASELVFDYIYSVYNGGAAPDDIVAADFDNDGDQDFAITKAYYVKVFLNPGNGEFSPNGQLINTGGGTVNALHVNDVNGDGYRDIVAMNGDSDSVHVLFNDGNGAFSALDTYPVTSPVDLSSGDFDGDGDVDVVVTGGNWGGYGVVLMSNQGSAGFTSGDPLGVPGVPRSVDVADVNSDGWPDIAVGHAYGVTVLRNGGDGMFSTVETYSIDASTVKGGFADMNTDGHVDLVLATDGYNSWGYVAQDLWVMLNDTTGSFEPANSVYSGNERPHGPPTSLVFADLDGDGDNDIARYARRYPYIELHQNDGSAQFVRAPLDASGYHNGRAIAAADFNGDGFRDLISAGANIHIAVFVFPNLPPIADAGGPYLLPVGGQVTLDGSASSDPDGDSLTETWTADGGTVSGNILTADSLPGVFEVQLVVNDGTIDSQPATTIAVIYDPSGGFVTGGGWIDSPQGAYMPDTSLSGSANFGFVSKYKKGAGTPTGETEFQFQVADLNFHSDTYDWLVVAGAKAQYKGTGTINGESSFRFMLTAIDAEINRSDSFEIDRFRIKIWTEDDMGVETVFYDNAIGDERDEAITGIGGGSIVIHKGKGK